MAIDDASYVLSKIEIATWGPTLNKHHCAVLAAPGVNGILAARIATGLFRESNLHIPNDQYLNEQTAVLAARIETQTPLPFRTRNVGPSSCWWRADITS